MFGYVGGTCAGRVCDVGGLDGPVYGERVGMRAHGLGVVG